MKPTLLFADTTSIITAHICSQWEHLCAHYDVRIVDEIVDESAHYYDANGDKRYLDLDAEVKAGKVTLVPVSTAQMALLAEMLQEGTRARMHPGELALVAAAMQMDDFTGVAVVTGDGAAIGVAEGLGIGVVSLEAALRSTGGRPSLPRNREDATEANVSRLKQHWSAKRVQGKVFHADKLQAWENSRPLP